MNLSLAKHERLSLRDLPGFSESWLHDRISDDPSLLGLGELDVVARERSQHGAGRLDMLLVDSEEEGRYEVEIMLGATDPSHIIRCIEYWDIERRRYTAYDHVAVLVAEEVTSRFLNVIALLAGSIPIVAIQLNALRVGDHIVLNFVKVLDQRQLREEDIAEPRGIQADRSKWEGRVGAAIMQVCDRVASLANEIADPLLELQYQLTTVSLCPHGHFFNAAAMFPKKHFIAVRLNISDAEEWMKRLGEADIDATSRAPESLVVRIRPTDLRDKEPLIRELIHQRVREFQA